MNWLDPKEVEAYIGNRVCNCKQFSRDCPSCLDDKDYALEQFVLSLADPAKPTTVHEARQMFADARAVARLLKKAMER